MKTQPIGRDTSVDDALTALYREHALRLTRLAYVMLGDRGAAEDIVQESFAGLHRNWGRLADQSRAVFYLRSSVLNGCRDVLRRSTRSLTLTLVDELPDAPRTVTPSAESSVLSVEERQAVITAIRSCLPASARPWYSASTLTSRSGKSRGSWASARAPSGPPPPAPETTYLYPDLAVISGRARSTRPVPGLLTASPVLPCRSSPAPRRM